MKTPITDRCKNMLYGTVPAEISRRLELDRAALMKALKWLDNWLGHKPMPECSKRITDALAAARANFPEP